jgi:Holliday junction DNA helicase RuvA
MIGRLAGILLEKQAPYLLIDVNGVGYDVQAPMTSFYPLPDVGGAVVLHTHLSVSENAHQLFGFYTREERLLFRTLIKVNGVGPKMALAILSAMSPEEFVKCVRSDSVTALVRVPGVGKKTAERLIVEVKDRLKDFRESADDMDEQVIGPPQISSQSLADAEEALVALGYKPVQAAKMVSVVATDHQNTDSQTLIRLALKNTTQQTI